jgi:hypothetical protein
MHQMLSLPMGKPQQEANAGNEIDGLFRSRARSYSFAFNGRKNKRDINREQCV